MKNRRKADRVVVHKSAAISHLDPRVKFKCVIDDLSATGAHLRFPYPMDIPDTLTLSIPGDNLVLKVDVRWQAYRECGVQFNHRIAHPLLTIHRMHHVAEHIASA
jgi:hypothetical protein